ncbi:MAG TPA: hypothetical protein VFS08_18580 [Gemmatimonadaceae bacterium]|nr:hypothetical protein [Gemmatimonadaceae bacterium]
MLALLLVGIAGGCSLDAEDEIQIVPVFTRSDHAIPDPGTPRNVSIQANAVGIILTNGEFVMPCRVGAPTARLEQQGENLKLRVVYQPPADCDDAPMLVDYSIALSNVPVGPYHFSVVHEGDFQVPNGTTVAEEDVTVF